MKTPLTQTALGLVLILGSGYMVFHGESALQTGLRFIAVWCVLVSMAFLGIGLAHFIRGLKRGLWG